MTYDEIRFAWNAQADDGNGWYSLSEYEKVEYAARIGAEKERAARQAAQAEVAELKERIARAGVEHRRALHDAVLEEREACAAACDALVDTKEAARIERRVNDVLQTGDEEDQLQAMRHQLTVSTFNVGIKNCAAAIRARN